MGATIPEMKLYVADELESIYLDNKLTSLKVLDMKLSIPKLSTTSQGYINKNPEIKKHYLIIKNKLLERRSLELIIYFNATYEKALLEKEKQQLQAELMMYLIQNIGEQKEKQRLQNIINQKEEESQRQLKLINDIMDREKEKEKAEIEKEREKYKTDLLIHKQEIEKANQEIKDLKKEAEQKNQQLLDYLLDFENQMDKMKAENEKKLKESEERFKKDLEEKYNEKIKKDLDKKIKEAKDEIEIQRLKKEFELNDKKEKLKKMFKDEMNNLQEKKVKQVMYLYERNEENICKEEIIAYINKSNNEAPDDIDSKKKKPNDKEMKDKKTNKKNILIKLTKDLSNSENMYESALYHLNNFVIDCQKEIKNIEHLNIILVGPSGAGKTTLINALLKLNLQEGFGSPQTKKIEYHISDTIPFLRLADSKGIEKNREADVEEISKAVEAFIQEQLDSNDPDKYIHCIWYCFEGTRLEGSEIKVLKKMSEIYTTDKLPVIIVYTQAINLDHIEKAKNFIYNELKLNNEFIEVLAQEVRIVGDNKIMPKNLDILIQKSLEKCLQSVNSSCFQAKLNEIKGKINEKFDELMINLKNNLENKVRNSLLNLNEKSDTRKFYELAKNMVFEIINSFFLLNGDIQFDEGKGYKAKLNDNIENELSDASRIQVESFVNEYFEYVIEALKKKMENDINIYTEDLVKEIIEKQLDINSRNQYLLEFDVTKEQLTNEIVKPFISQKITEKLKFIVLKNAVKNLINPLIEMFGKCYNKLYQVGMKDEDFIQKAKDSVKISFDELDKKIKEYNNKKDENHIDQDEENIEENKEENEEDMDEAFEENAMQQFQKRNAKKNNKK